MSRPIDHGYFEQLRTTDAITAWPRVRRIPVHWLLVRALEFVAGAVIAVTVVMWILEESN